MSLVVNNNLMAANTARTLNQHYGRLQTSTQRLSSGLRINSAADDAAGLAIRELQRADIAALQQGARNANDAISMIQTADGALGIIDEKLIRMKELAEQAATGTYDSTQRLMIESEYQAMASEITRIANATDFNGTKLLDGTLDGEHDGSGLVSEGKMKIHFGSGNDSAEDYYYITIGECTAQAFGLGNASTWQDVQNRAVNEFQTSLEQQIKKSGLTPDQKAGLLSQIGVKDENGNYTKLLKEYNDAISSATNPANAFALLNDDSIDFLKYAQDNFIGNSNLLNDFIAAGAADANAAAESAYKTAYDASIAGAVDPANPTATEITAAEAAGEAAKANAPKTADEAYTAAYDASIAAAVDPANPTAAEITTAEAAGEAAKKNFGTGIDDFWGKLRETEKQKLTYAFGQAAVQMLAEGKADDLGATLTFTGPESAAILDKALDDAYNKVDHMDFAGHTIETQEDAQHALVAITDAIESKDKIRAHLGATQNRLENTITNLNIQAENLQAAESRISDVDVATEMTQFVRNQILTQSAVAMLGQANSLPQMAMQLIGG